MPMRAPPTMKRLAVGAQRRPGERQRPLGQRVDLAVEAVERAQRGDQLRPRCERRTEQRIGEQQLQIVAVEPHRGGVLEDLAQPAEDHVVAVARQLAKEERHRHRRLRTAGVGVRDQRRQLVGVDGEGVEAHARALMTDHRCDRLDARLGQLDVDARARRRIDRAGQIVDDEDAEARARAVDGGGAHAEVACQAADVDAARCRARAGSRQGRWPGRRRRESRCRSRPPWRCLYVTST